MNNRMWELQTKELNIKNESERTSHSPLHRKTTIIFAALAAIAVFSFLLSMFVSWYRGEYWEKTFSEQEWLLVEKCIESMDEDEIPSAYGYMQMLFNILGYDKSAELHIVSARLEYLPPEKVYSIFEYDFGSGGYALILLDSNNSEYLLWSHYHWEGLAINGVKRFLMQWIL